jgi:hypothetical protein
LAPAWSRFGDLVGSAEAQECSVVGETPNLAARLQAGATPGTIAIDPTTRRLLGGLFEYRDLGGIEARRFASRVQAYEGVRPSMVESRFEALRTTNTPLIGRDEEIELLLRRWDQAKRDEGCVVLVAGEPGIGKSRIAETILQRLSNEPHTRLRVSDSPLRFVQGILRGVALGDIELIFGQRLFLIADPALQPFDIGGYGAARSILELTST